MGENGTGKTTFIKILAGLIKPDEGELPNTVVSVSYKPQKISPDFNGTVGNFLTKKLGNLQFDVDFKEIVLKPLCLEKLESKDLKNLSGGNFKRSLYAVVWPKNLNFI